MSVIDKEVFELEPRQVFEHFIELSKIPRPSGHTDKISKYMVDFAKRHGLEYIRDEVNNVIIKKPGTKGKEDNEPIILQSHLDMVCEKNMDCDKDFFNDGIDLYVDGDLLRARGTTLGADDGIGVALAMAFLASNKLEHPPIEAIFTIDEETGMDGAAAIDLSSLKGRRMINIDSDDEGVFLTSCAGGLRAELALDVDFVKSPYKKGLRIFLGGMMGGHSGVEIDKMRLNSNKLMGRVLTMLKDEGVSYSLASLMGGDKDNAIPRECVCVIGLDELDRAKGLVENLIKDVANENASRDKDVFVRLEEVDAPELVLSEKKNKDLVFLVNDVVNGITSMSSDIKGLVETSLNLGRLELKENEAVLTFAVRSSVDSLKRELVSRLKNLIEFVGGRLSTHGDYPEWAFVRDSKLRELVVSTYRDTFNKEPKIQAIHAGLECGLLSRKLEGLDIISMGPEANDIHTPMESLSISSTGRYFLFLIELMKRL